MTGWIELGLWHLSRNLINGEGGTRISCIYFFQRLRNNTPISTENGTNPFVPHKNEGILEVKNEE